MVISASLLSQPSMRTLATVASIESVFPSTEAMEQILAMGAEEGLQQAVGQIDAILAEDGVSRR